MSDARLAVRNLPEGVQTTAMWGSALRDDGTPLHRYILTWDHPSRTGPWNLVIGANPSGASLDVADQTLLKVWTFCGRWNNGRLVMMNVNPFRATEPREMRFEADVLQRNETLLHDQAYQITQAGGRVVAAWGSPATISTVRRAFRRTSLDVWRAVVSAGADVMCMGETSDRQPRHPLMLPYDTPLAPWAPNLTRTRRTR